MKFSTRTRRADVAAFGAAAGGLRPTRVPQRAGGFDHITPLQLGAGPRDRAARNPQLARQVARGVQRVTAPGA